MNPAHRYLTDTLQKIQFNCDLPAEKKSPAIRYIAGEKLIRPVLINLQELLCLQQCLMLIVDLNQINAVGKCANIY
jgi:hypothetical protein